MARLAVSAADALVASGHPDRAAAVLAEQLALLPADAPDAWRARILAARASALAVIETDEDPAELSARALALVPPGADDLRAHVAGAHARTLAAMGRYDEAQAVGLDALALAEKLDLNAVASDAMTTLSGLKKSGPTHRAARRPGRRRAARGGQRRRGGAAARALHARPLLRGLGRVRRGRAVVPLCASRSPSGPASPGRRTR